MPTRLRDARRSLQAILRNPALRRIEVAFLGFNVVEYGTWIAILVYANDATGPASVGVVAVAQLLPSAAYAPVAASLGDRYPRIRVLTGGYVLMAAALLGVGLAMAVGAHPLVVYPLAIVAAASMTMPRPVQAAVTPSFAETPEQLTAANGLNTIFEGLGILGGPLAAGLLMTVGSPALVFGAAGILALICIGLVAGLSDRIQVKAADDGGTPAAVREPSLLAGFRAVARDRTQALVVALLAARFVVVGALDVLIVLMATEALALSGAAAGFLGAALGFGGVVGGLVTLVLVGRRGLAGWMVAGSIGAGVGLLLIAARAEVGAVILLLGVAGIGLACLDVAGRTLLQRISEGDLLSGVFGVVEGSAMLGLAVGSLAASLLFQAFGLAGATAATAAVLPAIALVAWLPLRRADAALDVPVVQIGLLQRLPLFSLVPGPALEAAAARLVRFTLPARAIVFREGDPGDRFYVVASGSVEVIRSGQPVRRLGPGQSFGEIALLHNVPRTATIAAVDDSELWALDREAFLLAITGSPRAVAEAEARTELLLGADRLRGASA